MFKIIAVTDRTLCPNGKDSFLRQIERIAGAGVKSIILREKDLAPKDYRELAADVMALCAARNVEFIAHGFLDTAQNLNLPLHLPWALFGDLLNKDKAGVNFGVSVHSIQGADLAIEQGASWLVAGHIYPVKSKKGIAARGTEFLSGICRMSPVPVYGIGGINKENIRAIADSGAKGACLMSSLMQSPDPFGFVNDLLENIP